MKNSMEGKVQSKVPGEHTYIPTLNSVSRGQEGSSFSLTMSFLSPPLRVTALTPSRSAWRSSLIQPWITVDKTVEIDSRIKSQVSSPENTECKK